MSLRVHLDEVISRWNLLDHPFYQAWNRGELPVEALATYAREYGAFITRVAGGWMAHGDAEIAAEEREHAAIWNDGFAAALGVQIGEPAVAQVQDLCRAVDARFASPAGSLGGLYAFEAQQPHTSGSKLKGLREHYALGETAEEYFVIHETDFAEPALLAERIEALDAAGQAEAQAACAEVSEALWNALTGICEKHGIACGRA